jgi:hypothetical protein
MSMTLEEVSREAVQLPRDQRLALARILLDLDPPSCKRDSDSVWEQEILARVKGFDEGLVQTVSYDAFKREMEGRLSS